MPHLLLSLIGYFCILLKGVIIPKNIHKPFFNLFNWFCVVFFQEEIGKRMTVARHHNKDVGIRFEFLSWTIIVSYKADEEHKIVFLNVFLYAFKIFKLSFYHRFLISHILPPNTRLECAEIDGFSFFL